MVLEWCAPRSTSPVWNSGTDAINAQWHESAADATKHGKAQWILGRVNPETLSNPFPRIQVQYRKQGTTDKKNNFDQVSLMNNDVVNGMGFWPTSLGMEDRKTDPLCVFLQLLSFESSVKSDDKSRCIRKPRDCPFTQAGGCQTRSYSPTCQEA
jgi:hypothetical protein